MKNQPNGLTTTRVDSTYSSADYLIKGTENEADINTLKLIYFRVNDICIGCDLKHWKLHKRWTCCTDQTGSQLTFMELVTAHHINN
ncbi:hypothetical protein KP79_PYT09335 [Mizuhopecten yessoensis]|uniref:Uncharacterized protein n=1 Tax=Mizuhopecten yessoensis TaxID=6573 RepID=A0A210PJL1_MIZYE|nr:hypothetical protein KP79_PYT09335 [Mizuhopecten yessoensis]